MVIVNVALMRKENERGVDADFTARMEAVEWDEDAELEFEDDSD